MLRRYHYGARHVWRVVTVPSVDAEDQRPLHRDLETLKPERARTSNRLKGVLRSQGLRLARVHTLPEQLDALRLWDGAPVPRGLRGRLLRVYAHAECLGQQIAEVEADRRALLRHSHEAAIERVRQRMQLKGIGIKGAWWFVRACFGWRALQTRREVGG
jgi:transposase